MLRGLDEADNRTAKEREGPTEEIGLRHEIGIEDRDEIAEPMLPFNVRKPVVEVARFGTLTTFSSPIGTPCDWMKYTLFIPFLLHSVERCIPFAPTFAGLWQTVAFVEKYP